MAVLTKSFPLRFLQIAGTFLAALGIGLCGVAVNDYEVILLYGVLAGEFLLVPFQFKIMHLCNWKWVLKCDAE